MASVNKVQGALADLNGQSKPHVWLMTYVQTTKDKQVGVDQSSILVHAAPYEWLAMLVNSQLLWSVGSVCFFPYFWASIWTTGSPVIATPLQSLEV